MSFLKNIPLILLIGVVAKCSADWSCSLDEQLYFPMEDDCQAFWVCIDEMWESGVCPENM